MLIIKIHNIQTEPVLMVTEDCPIGIFSKNMVFGNDRKYKYCQKCDFFTKENQCAYNLYETTLLDRNSICEDDECDYALPQTNYGWMFRCAKCGETITFASGYSVMQRGHQEKCFTCKTKYLYLGNEDGIYSFAIPMESDTQ